MFEFVTLSGGPLDGQVSEIWEPGETIDAGVPEGLYVRNTEDTTQYTWTEGIKPVADVFEPKPAALPEAVLTHLPHLRDYASASPTAITNAQTVHVVQDIIKALFFLNRRFEDEG